MTIKQLRAFLAVAHTLNFRERKAEYVATGPESGYRGLEEVWGRIADANHAAGHPYAGRRGAFPMARQLIADCDNAEEAMRQRFTLQRGKVSVAAMPSFAANALPRA
jgi:LysR family carnitine catabolism transcriptional activator